MKRAAVLFAIAIAGAACASPAAEAPPTAVAHVATPASTSSTVDSELATVAAIHGGAGPWVVAGYRMGEYAMKQLGLDRYSFDLDVQHHTPHKVQYSCIADGAAAATGASVGKLNLTIVDADDAHVATTYRRKSTGRAITLRPTQAFAARFKDIPREHLGTAGREVIALRDEEIFEVVPESDVAHP